MPWAFVLIFTFVPDEGTATPSPSMAFDRTTRFGALGRVSTASAPAPVASYHCTIQASASSAFFTVARTSVFGSSRMNDDEPGRRPG
jgi:hypothetical protein